MRFKFKSPACLQIVGRGGQKDTHNDKQTFQYLSVQSLILERSGKPAEIPPTGDKIRSLLQNPTLVKMAFLCFKHVLVEFL